MEYEKLSDEELAEKCAQHINEAERTLLNRYMSAIYWLPQKNFGADEEDLSDFLIFALEKIRDRHILEKFNPENGARFSSWFGIVIRNLYFDYLRDHKYDPAFVALNTEELIDQKMKEDESDKNAEELLGKMEIKCRTLFKMLLLNCFFLAPDEIRWIAEESGQSIMQVVYTLSQAEEDLCEKDAKTEEKRNQLSAVYWWKSFYEQKYCYFQKRMELPEEERDRNVEKMYNMMCKRREQHERILEELKNNSGINTTPYQKIADILRMKEGTLASNISRCRHKAAQIKNELH